MFPNLISCRLNCSRKMIKIAILLVCVAICYAEPQRPNFYLPVPFNQHGSVGPYNYVRVMQQPFHHPVNRVPVVTTNRLPSPSYPTIVRLPALPSRRQFRLPPGGYFIIPASALYGQQHESSILAAQRFFRPIGLPTAPQVRPAGAEDDECQDDSADLQSTEETEE